MISSHEDKNKDKQRCFLVVMIGGESSGFRGADDLINSIYNEDPENLTFDLPQNAPIIARRFFEYLCVGNHNEKFLNYSGFAKSLSNVKEVFGTDFGKKNHYQYRIVTLKENSNYYKEFSLSDYSDYDDKNERGALYLCLCGPNMTRIDCLARHGFNMLIVELDIPREEFINRIERNSINFDFLIEHVKGVAINDRIEYRKGPYPKYNNGVISVNKDRALAISNEADIEELKQALSKYIERIEKLPSYSDGFWFFKESRSINREANYLLAKKLYDDLSKPNASIENVFYDLKNKRGILIHQNIKNVDVKRYTDWGIYSDELNNIIRKAGEMVKKEKQPARKPKGHSI